MAVAGILVIIYPPQTCARGQVIGRAVIRVLGPVCGCHALKDGSRLCIIIPFKVLNCSAYFSQGMNLAPFTNL